MFLKGVSVTCGEGFLVTCVVCWCL